MSFCRVYTGIKLGSGEYIPKSHMHYDEVLEQSTVVQLAHSEGWKAVLVELIGCIWDVWIALGEDGGHLKTFWESYFVAPWCIWSVCDNMHVPGMLPSNQMCEAFFRNVVRLLGGREQMRGSSEKVLNRMFPLIMAHQDANLPDRLCFEVSNHSTIEQTQSRIEISCFFIRLTM